MDALSCSEIWSILSQLDIKDNIPKNVLKIIDNNRIKEYDANIDLNFSLEQQIIGSKTISLLCYININYLCTKEEKEVLYKIYNKTKKSVSSKKTNLYNRNTLLPVVIKKKTWYEKLYTRAFSFFKTLKGVNAYEK